MCQRNAPCKLFDLFSTLLLLMPFRLLPIGRLTCLAIETKSNRIEMKMKSKQNLFISTAQYRLLFKLLLSRAATSVSAALTEWTSSSHVYTLLGARWCQWIYRTYVARSSSYQVGCGTSKNWVMEININAHCGTCYVFYQKSQSRHQFVSAVTSIESSRPRLVTTTTTTAAAAMKTSV